MPGASEKSRGRITKAWMDKGYGPWRLFDQEFWTCPKTQAHKDWPRLVTMYRAYEKGNMLMAGGLSDQPRWYASLMPAIGAYLEQAYEDAHKDRKAVPV